MQRRNYLLGRYKDTYVFSSDAFCPATALHGSVALPFVIPSEAEGSAVPRTTLGNVFRQSVA
jgi:hypothetical protein